MFFNKMYLLGDNLYDCLNKVMVNRPLSIREKANFLWVKGSDCYYLFDCNGNIEHINKRDYVFKNKNTGYYLYSIEKIN